MGTTTFSGPVKAGTIREGANENTGYVVMAQTVPWVQSATAAKSGIRIPAGSQILEHQFNITVAPATGNLSAGTTVAANELFTGLASGTAANVMLFGTAATIPDGDAWADVGAADVDIWVDSSAGTTGRGFLTVTYLQAIDLA